MLLRESPIHKRAGSFALEAALAVPVFMIMLSILLAGLVAIETDIKVKGALDRTALELSLMSPACLLAEQGLQPASDAQAADGYDLQPLDDLIAEICPGQSLGSLTADLLFDLSSTAVIGPILQKRMDFWLNEALSGQSGWEKLLGERRMYLDWRYEEQQLWLCLNYDLQTPAGLFRRHAVAAVPLWTGLRSDHTSDDGDIWLLDNFTRGRILRQRFSANLPYDFPVIAAWSDGEAVMIKSVDLTAPTYQTALSVDEHLCEMIDRLAAFRGADYCRQDKQISIAAAEIQKRTLLIIIPANAGQDWLDNTLDTAGDYGQACGVSLNVIRFGNSTRYQQSTEDQP